MESGYFNNKRLGSYIITNENLETSYAYNLLNNDILVCLDQNGFSSIQFKAPQDIALIKRELNEKYSKWLTFIKCDNKTYSNFNRPFHNTVLDFRVEFYPEKAIYFYKFENFALQTTIFIPEYGSDVICDIELTNLSLNEKKFELYGQVCPYINEINLVAWDKPEWYLRTALSHDSKKNLTYFTRLMNAKGIKENRRNTSFTFSGDSIDSGDYYMERYIGSGDFYNPSALNKERLSYDFSVNENFSDMCENNSIAGFTPVFSAKYNVSLKPNEKKHFTQIFNVLSQCDGEIPGKTELEKTKKWLNVSVRDEEIAKVKSNYEKMFEKNYIKTNDAEFDNYINSFLPLQMQWVSALDRGWPTGMSGTRDASNDFMGMLIYDANKSKEKLLHLFDCQQFDGWFPRQVSKDKNLKHDMRKYVDGGVFVIEFLYEYLCYTKEYDFLDIEIGYSNCDSTETILQHVIKAIDYYKNNIGKDNLCKIYEGDWFDGINQAGLLGVGESVTASCQFCLSICYIKSIMSIYHKKIDITAYEQLAFLIKDSLNRLAYNTKGYYNGVSNDLGQWIFSDHDPDEVDRMYSVPNSFAIFSGVANSFQVESVLKNISCRLKSDYGYKLFYPPFYKPIPNVGRVSGGEVMPGLLGNATVYNHGSQAFLCRACCYAGYGDMAKEVLSWTLPYDKKYHDEKETKSPPYAIVNYYADIAPCKHKAGFLFLTGTVAMVVRIIYNFIFGIRPNINGLTIQPCLYKEFSDGKVKYNYNSKELNISYVKSNINNVSSNGKSFCYIKDIVSQKKVAFIADKELYNGMDILVKYKS